MKSVLGPYDADFRDNHLGGLWMNDIYDTPQFDWKTHRGDTRTENTGPSTDHYGSDGNASIVLVDGLHSVVSVFLSFVHSFKSLTVICFEILNSQSILNLVFYISEDGSEILFDLSF